MLSNEHQIEEFIKNRFTSKSGEFYSKVIRKAPHRWQQVSANSSEYIIGSNVIALYCLKNKFDGQKRKLFATQHKKGIYNI